MCELGRRPARELVSRPARAPLSSHVRSRRVVLLVARAPRTDVFSSTLSNFPPFILVCVSRAVLYPVCWALLSSSL